jgi:hypothetical protein
MRSEKVAWGTTNSSDDQKSLNVARFSDSASSPWMLMLLSSPFFNYGSEKFGTPNRRFDTLQLTFSYLVLSPISPYAKYIENSKDRYDIKRVYNWGEKFSTLYKMATAEQLESLEKGWKGRRQYPAFGDRVYDLDMYSILHIRNFWHHHLLDSTSKAQEEDFGLEGERLYRAMMRRATKSGHSPSTWTAALRDTSMADEPTRRYKWYGTYGCIHPWPKKDKVLEERQSCADKWEKVDAMVSTVC